MPASITLAPSTLSYSYDSEHARTMEVGPNGTTIYLNPRMDSGIHVEGHVLSPGVVNWENYIYAAGQTVAIQFDQTAGGGATSTRYLHKDHLGSTQALTDETGARTEYLSYDPYGKRRFANGSDDPNNTITSATHHGFTGHEHLVEVGLIHMNGRVYDPLVGRFLTADPTLASVLDSQAFNRYAYLKNNPLRDVDPSGYCGFFSCITKFFSHVVKAVVQTVTAVVKTVETAVSHPAQLIEAVAVIAVAVVTAQPELAIPLWGQVAAVGATAGVIGGASCGCITGALTAAAAAAAMTYASSVLDSWRTTTMEGDTSSSVSYGQIQRANTNWYAVIAKTAIAGGIGGAANKVQGGSFVTGLEFSAGFQFSDELYRALVPWQPPVLGNGEARFDKEVEIRGDFTDPVAVFRDADNTGVAANPLLGHFPGDGNVEGAPLLHFLDHHVPFLEATAQFHDSLLGWFAPGGAVQPTSQILNFGTMVPAFSISTGSFLRGAPAIGIARESGCNAYESHAC